MKWTDLLPTWRPDQDSPGRIAAPPKAYHKGRALVKVISWAKKDEDDYLEEDREWAASYADANVLSSQTNEMNIHLPVLDLDIEHEYIPSSTPGHAHLLINKPVRWQDYVRLLRLLADMGIIEEGYAEASIWRGSAQVRLPHVKKDSNGETT